MSMKKFKDKKNRLRRRRRRRQINHKISVPKIFIYNKLKEKLNWTPSRKDSAFSSQGDKSRDLRTKDIHIQLGASPLAVRVITGPLRDIVGA